MKLLWLIVDEGVAPDVADVLAQQGIKHWTRWENVQGAGRTGVRQGTPIWPGLNIIYLALVEPDVIPPLVERLIQVRDSFPMRPGMLVFSLEAEQLA